MNMIIMDGLSFALPLFIIAVGGIYCEKSGITNLALEGLQGVGAFTGALAGVLVSGYFAKNSAAPFYITMAASVLGGMLYSLLHAALCIRFRANQIISGVVVNILAVALTSFLTKQINISVFGQASDKFQLGVIGKLTVPGLSGIPVIGAVFSERYPFEWMILALAVIAWYWLYQTRYGLRLQACGDHPQAVEAAGVNVARLRLSAVMISGGLSGLGGICFAYSISAGFSSGIYAGYGYLAIAALIFGNWSILPTLGACLLFGIARSGGYQMVRLLGLSGSYTDLAMILPYALTLILLVFYSGNSRAPRALGEIYDKGKR